MDAYILLDRKDVDASTLTRALQVIDRNAAAQARMIDDLLDVARIAAGKLRLELQAVDLRAVIIAAVDGIAPAARNKRLELRTMLDTAIPCVPGDPQRLQPIVGNLLSNAVKFTEPGGSVEVCVAPAGAVVRLTVKDTGAGISPAFLPLAFEPFKQAKPRARGGMEASGWACRSCATWSSCTAVRSRQRALVLCKGRPSR